ncbi:Rqc2 family fibronectin-binding protein [Helicovermis profundi]|uniref:Rqc2 homolog RqcH n=1 Tax=Helicovermis profundi TaxID=3065157 RepID=A0AAU9EIR8_9FIRM|nr:NFACT RNA binding domain-containing protein [Clostridia bacterium S502]
MAFDGIFIHSLVEELNKIIKDGKIDKVYQPEKDELTLVVKKNRKNINLLISCDASLPHITIIEKRRDNPKAPPMFCMLMRKMLVGSRIVEISQSGLERVITIKLRNKNEIGDTVYLNLIVEIMGKHSNIILTNNEFKIIDSIKRIPFNLSRVRQILPGLNYSQIPSGKLNLLTTNYDELLDKFNLYKSNKPVFKSIYMLLDGISPIVAKNICYLISLDASTKFDDVNKDDIISLVDNLISLQISLLNNKFTPFYVRQKNEEKLIDYHILELDLYKNEKNKIYHNDDIFKVINTYFSKKNDDHRIAQKFSNLRKIVSQRKDRLTNKISKLENELLIAENAEEFKICGELIIANIYKIDANLNEIELDNYYDENNPKIIVKLNPNLTPSENSQKYYKKYNKLKTAQTELKSQIEETNHEIVYLENVLSNIENSTDVENIEEIKNELIDTGYIKKKKLIKGKKRKVKALNPYEYLSSDGFKILVGKNSAQNDLLTLKSSSNKDIWLHTKIIPSSHVVIKTEGKEVPEKTILEAALICSYHSKAKMSSNVPVDYTAIKNVSKPNGAKPGMVIYVHYNTVYVTPKESEVLKLRKI